MSTKTQLLSTTETTLTRLAKGTGVIVFSLLMATACSKSPEAKKDAAKPAESASTSQPANTATATATATTATATSEATESEVKANPELSGMTLTE